MGDLSYDPFNWFWQVDGRSDYWSSAAAAYIETLPEGAGLTHIASEGELSDVLAVYGLAGPVPIVPDRVSARQFGLQLIAASIKDQVDTWIASQDDATKWAYQRSATFVRTDPMMQAGFAALGFTSTQIDAFFAAAAAL